MKSLSSISAGSVSPGLQARDCLWNTYLRVSRVRAPFVIVFRATSSRHGRFVVAIIKTIDITFHNTAAVGPLTLLLAIASLALVVAQRLVAAGPKWPVIIAIALTVSVTLTLTVSSVTLAVPITIPISSVTLPFSVSVLTIIVSNRLTV